MDRFHDDLERKPIDTADRRVGFGIAKQLQKICGGILKGITKHLDDIHELCSTALWLSPVVENNSFSYHGYAVENFLNIDPRFGSKQDHADLVDADHSLDIRVFLDIVLHHTENNWFYLGDVPYYYNQGVVFPFGN